MEHFKQQLLVVRQLFRCMLAEEQAQALALLRDLVTESQSVVRNQLASDAMRTVTAIAETMIHVCTTLIHTPFVGNVVACRR